MLSTKTAGTIKRVENTLCTKTLEESFFSKHGVTRFAYVLIKSNMTTRNIATTMCLRTGGFCPRAAIWICSVKVMTRPM